MNDENSKPVKYDKIDIVDGRKDEELQYANYKCEPVVEFPSLERLKVVGEMDYETGKEKVADHPAEEASTTSVTNAKDLRDPRVIATEHTYACDRKTVRALAQLIPAYDRVKVYAWLHKLDECADNVVRSQYSKFLLQAVAGGSVRADPFRRIPPQGPLQLLDPILLTRTQTLDAEQPQSPGIDPPVPTTTRETFYDRQPIPKDGTFCYAAAFNDLQ